MVFSRFSSSADNLLTLLTVELAFSEFSIVYAPFLVSENTRAPVVSKAFTADKKTQGFVFHYPFCGILNISTLNFALTNTRLT